MKLPNVKKPCKNCPFRKDSQKGWLGKERAEEISKAETFVCHKTVDYTEENNQDNRLQCAGFMIMKKEESLFYTLAKRLKIKLELTGEELIFKSKKEFIKHHSKH